MPSVVTSPASGSSAWPTPNRYGRSSTSEWRTKKTGMHICEIPSPVPVMKLKTRTGTDWGIRATPNRPPEIISEATIMKDLRRLRSIALASRRIISTAPTDEIERVFPMNDSAKPAFFR
jgi:hypothetical protein